jgi:5'(3')-deoxyribonucleotidase
VYNKTFGTKLKESDVISYDLKESFPLCISGTKVCISDGPYAEIWGEIKSGHDFFFHDKAEEVFLDAETLLGVEEAFQMLKVHCNVIVITNQFSVQNKTYALEWLERQHLDPDGVMFTSNKNLANIDLLIDDNPRFIMESQCPTLLVNKTHNKDFDISTCQMPCQRIESLYSWVFSDAFKEFVFGG